MPIYEYACQKCGEFEVTQRMSDAPLKKCPTCGTKVTKLISSSAFHLKGSGWYITDYARNGSSKNESDSSKSTTSDTKSNSASSSPSSSAASSSSSTKESAASA